MGAGARAVRLAFASLPTPSGRPGQGRGVGKRLLNHAVDWLRSRGWRRLWLATDPDPTVRSHGFHRSRGWRPTGERQERAGDEILVLE
jgi:L-amino acid N-acyltransferase YncA